MTEFGSGFLAKLAPETVSAPEILTIEQCFAASDNATAVMRVRFYLDQLDLSVKRCSQCPSGECSLCVERGRITADIRALLPVVDTKT
jgi:hypothetical protein